MRQVTFTAILHAYRWPSQQTLGSLRAAIASAIPTGLDLVEACEDVQAAVGAAAVVNRAAKASAADMLLVLEPSTWFDPEVIASFAGGSRDGLVHDAEVPSRLWAIPRGSFNDAGGLDPRLWSIGYVEDLAARLAVRGGAVTPIRTGGVWHGPDPYPLRAEVRDFLAIRNRLMTAFKTSPVPDLGRELAFGAALALIRAWRSADLDASAFSFGSPMPLTLRPVDEGATLVSLLALDAFLGELPALARERQRSREAGPPAPGPAAGQAAGDTDLLEWLHSHLARAGT
jgi:hypothetical protein